MCTACRAATLARFGPPRPTHRILWHRSGLYRPARAGLPSLWAYSGTRGCRHSCCCGQWVGHAAELVYVRHGGAQIPSQLNETRGHTFPEPIARASLFFHTSKHACLTSVSIWDGQHVVLRLIELGPPYGLRPLCAFRVAIPAACTAIASSASHCLIGLANGALVYVRLPTNFPAHQNIASSGTSKSKSKSKSSLEAVSSSHSSSGAGSPGPAAAASAPRPSLATAPSVLDPEQHIVIVSAAQPTSSIITGHVATPEPPNPVERTSASSPTGDRTGGGGGGGEDGGRTLPSGPTLSRRRTGSDKDPNPAPPLFRRDGLRPTKASSISQLDMHSRAKVASGREFSSGEAGTGSAFVVDSAQLGTPYVSPSPVGLGATPLTTIVALGFGDGSLRIFLPGRSEVPPNVQLHPGQKIVSCHVTDPYLYLLAGKAPRMSLSTIKSSGMLQPLNVPFRRPDISPPRLPDHAPGPALSGSLCGPGQSQTRGRHRPQATRKGTGSRPTPVIDIRLWAARHQGPSFRVAGLATQGRA